MTTQPAPFLATSRGWASTRTIGELATAAVLLAAFAVTEARRRDPLFPFSILPARGRGARQETRPEITAASHTAARA